MRHSIVPHCIEMIWEIITFHLGSTDTDFCNRLKSPLLDLQTHDASQMFFLNA